MSAVISVNNFGFRVGFISKVRSQTVSRPFTETQSSTTEAGKPGKPGWGGPGRSGRTPLLMSSQGKDEKEGWRPSSQDSHRSNSYSGMTAAMFTWAGMKRRGWSQAESKLKEIHRKLSLAAGRQQVRAAGGGGGNGRHYCPTVRRLSYILMHNRPFWVIFEQNGFLSLRWSH